MPQPINLTTCFKNALSPSIVWFGFLFATATHAELVGLDDELMESVSGQTGLTIEMHQQLEVSEVLYSDKDDVSGGILELKDIVIGHPDDVENQQAVSVRQIDADGTDGLVIRSTYQPTRLKIGSISVGAHRGTVSNHYADRKSFGTVIYDWTGSSVTKIKGKSGGETGLIINGSTNITDADLRWSTNGNTLLLDHLTFQTSVTDMAIDVMDNGSQAYLNIAVPAMDYDFKLGGLCFSEAKNCDSNQSFGSLAGNMAFQNSFFKIYGGGREGAGITIDAYLEINQGEGNAFSYTDEALLTMADMSGSVNIEGLTFDIDTADTEIGDHISLQLDSMVGNFRAETLEIGAGKAIGHFEVLYDFHDGEHNGQLYQNKVKLAPGVAWAGQSFADLDAYGFSELQDFYAKVGNYGDGLSLYTEWNLTADAIYTDRDNLNVPGANLPGMIVISHFQSYGSGYASLDIRNGNSINSNHNASESYLALGFRNIKGSYSMEGLKVGDANAPLQGGTELLLPLGIYPSYDFTLNGGVEIRGGGANGSGLTFDGDLLITDGTFALSTNILNYGQPDQRTVGIWADNVTYEYHFRNYTLDVGDDNSSPFTGDAIRLRQGELWSDMDIGNFRWGDKETGKSLGRVRLQRYQTDSQLVIRAGGAGVDANGTALGASCIGGSGGSEAACEASGGHWIDRGTDGVTIGLKQNWLDENQAQDKRNALTWENNRTLDAQGNPADGTGTSLTLHNMRTSDGYNLSDNEFGMQLELAVDVAPTKVVKKTDGVDENGVVGDRGDEKIMTGANTYVYKKTGDLTSDEKANRPLGFAVRAQLQFKELDIEAVQLKHPNVTAPQTVVHGLKMQNFNMTSNLTATPIQ